MVLSGGPGKVGCVLFYHLLAAHKSSFSVNYHRTGFLFAQVNFSASKWKFVIWFFRSSGSFMVVSIYCSLQEGKRVMDKVTAFKRIRLGPASSSFYPRSGFIPEPRMVSSLQKCLSGREGLGEKEMEGVRLIQTWRQMWAMTVWQQQNKGWREKNVNVIYM